MPRKNKSEFNRILLMHGMRVKYGKRKGTIQNILRSVWYGTDVHILWDDGKSCWMKNYEVKPTG